MYRKHDSCQHLFSEIQIYMNTFYNLEFHEWLKDKNKDQKKKSAAYFT